MRGGPGDPADKLVRLVDDHRVVLGQGGAAVHGVDRQQGMVGHHQLGGAGLVTGPFHEALPAVGAALHTEAFAHRDRHLRPRLGAVGRRVVAIGKASGVGLVLDPLA